MRFSKQSVVRVVVAGSLVLESMISAGAAHASPPYLDNITGNIVVRYAHKNPTTGTYDITPLPVFPPSLKQTFDDQWTTVRSKLCPDLKHSVPANRWGACDLQVSGDLQAAQSSPNSLDLKYLLTNNHLNFDLPMSPLPDATFDVYFDVELDVSGGFDGSIDGKVWSGDPVYRGSPMTINSANIHLQNVSIHTSNIVATLFDMITGKIGAEETALNKTSFSVTDPIRAHAQDVNALFHDGAAQLGALIQKAEPTSNQFFNLDVTLDPVGAVVVQLRRDYDPPLAPVNLQVTNAFPAYNMTWSPGLGGLCLPHGGCPTQNRPVLDYQVERMDYAWQQGMWVLAGSPQATSFLDHAPGVTSYGVDFAYRVSAVNLYGRATSAQAGDPGQWPGTGGGTTGQPIQHCNPCLQ